MTPAISRFTGNETVHHQADGVARPVGKGSHQAAMGAFWQLAFFLAAAKAFLEQILSGENIREETAPPGAMVMSLSRGHFRFNPFRREEVEQCWIKKSKDGGSAG